MRLPNANQAAVGREKIADYLLNPVHPDNGGKADFFTQLGFHRERWEVLAVALKALAVSAEVTGASETPHGKKYVTLASLSRPAANRHWCKASG